MKKIITLMLPILTGLFANSQMTGKLIQGTIKPGTSSNTIKAVVKSSASFRGQFSNVQFTFQIPNSIIPQPTITIKNNFLSDYIQTSNYKIQVTNEDGYYNYLFAAVATNSPLYNFVAGNEIDALEIEIKDISEKNIPVRLSSLPNGGSTGQLNFYIEVNGNDNTNVTLMFYGTSAVNKGSYSKYSYVSLPVSVEPLNSIPNKVLVYPTLSQGIVNVRLPAGYENARIKIIDAIGKEVGYDESNNLNRTINLKNLQSGAYVVRVINKSEITNNVKIILQR